MATETTNLKLNKPDKTDFYNIDLINDNMDKIDKAIGDKANKTDIPTKLPANGGNADTVGGKRVHELSQKAYLVANGVDLFEYIESLTDEQLPPHGTVIIRAFNCKNSPLDGFPAKVVISQSNGGDFIITVTRLEHKDWYILTAREVSTRKMFTCGKRDNVWQPWTQAIGFSYLPDRIDILNYVSTKAFDGDRISLRCLGAVNAPHTNSDFFFDVWRLSDVWIKVQAYEMGTNEVYLNSKINGNWTGWRKLNDGGNADTVDGWHVELRPQNFYGLRPIAMDTFDLQAGITPMSPGQIYIMYE